MEALIKYTDKLDTDKKITLVVYPDSFKEEENMVLRGTFIKTTLSGGFLDMFFTDTSANNAILEYKAIADNDYFMGTGGVLDGTIDILSGYQRRKFNELKEYQRMFN